MQRRSEESWLEFLAVLYKKDAADPTYFAKAGNAPQGIFTMGGSGALFACICFYKFEMHFKDSFSTPCDAEPT